MVHGTWELPVSPSLLPLTSLRLARLSDSIVVQSQIAATLVESKGDGGRFRCGVVGALDV